MRKPAKKSDDPSLRLIQADVGLASALQALASDAGMMKDYRDRGFDADLSAATERRGRSVGEPLAVMCAKAGNEQSFRSAIEDFDPSETPVERGKDQDLDAFFATLVFCAKLNNERYFNPLARMALDESPQPRELFVTLWQAAREGSDPADPMALARLIEGSGCLDELARGSSLFLSQRPGNAKEASSLLRDLQALMSFESTRESLVWTHRIAAKKAALGKVKKASGLEANMKPMGAFLWGCLSKMATLPEINAQKSQASSDLSMRSPDDFDLALSFIRSDLVRDGILDDGDVSAMGSLLTKIPEGRRLAFAAAFERKAIEAEIESAMAGPVKAAGDEDDEKNAQDDWANELGLAPPPPPKSSGPRRI